MLKDKIAVITGCNRGIGKAILECYARNGATIIANSKTSGSIEDISKELELKYKVKIMRLYFDVSNYNEVKEGFKEIFKFTKYVDILVNNAGIMENALLPMVTEESINKIFSVNTFGTIYMMQYASRFMMKKKTGSIINISSIVGLNGNDGQIVYSGSKAAIVGITKSAAKEFAPYNIRVNAIAPGFIDTDMTRSLSEEIYTARVKSIKMQKIGSPEDIANSALFLGSDLSSYITGQIIGVDGGMVL